MADRTDTSRMFGLVNDLAESALISTAFNDREFAETLVAEVEPHTFYDFGKQRIAQGISDCLINGSAIDVANIIAATAPMVGDKLTPEFITGVVDEGRGLGDAAINYMAEIKNLGYLRAGLTFSEWFLKRIQSHPDPSAFFVESQEMIKGMTPATESDRWMSGEEARASYDDLSMPADKQDDLVLLQWPWEEMNKMMGPAVSQNLYLISAADGVGKSAFAAQVAESWAKTHKVALVTLEDTQKHKLRRRISRYAKVSLIDLRMGMSAAQRRQFEEAKPVMAEFDENLYIMEALGDLTMTRILAEVERKIEQEGIKALLVDYMGLQDYDASRGKFFGSKSFMYQEWDMVKLKHFARRLSIPVVAVTQQTKEGLKGARVNRAGIYGGARTYQVSQGVVLIDRPKCDDRSGEVDRSGRLVAKYGGLSSVGDIIIDKANEGSTGEFKMFYRGEFLTWEDWDEQVTLPEPDPEGKFGFI